MPAACFTELYAQLDLPELDIAPVKEWTHLDDIRVSLFGRTQAKEIKAAQIALLTPRPARPNFRSKEVTIHTQIASGFAIYDWLNEHPEVKGKIKSIGSVDLWYYGHAFDLDGRGYFYLHLDECSQILGKKIETIRKQIREGKLLGFFYPEGCLKLNENTYKIYYRSLWKVCHRFGLDSWGTTSKIQVESLRQRRQEALETEMQSQQVVSYRLAHRSGKGIRMLSPEELVSSVNGNRYPEDRPRQIQPVAKDSKDSGGVTYRLVDGPKMALLTGYKPYGVSQARLGERLGCSEVTVQRNLSNVVRLRLGMDALPRKQLAVLQPDLSVAELQMLQRENPDENQGLQKMFVYKDKVYEAKCNVYRSTVELISRTTNRRAFKRWRKQQLRLEARSLAG